MSQMRVLARRLLRIVVRLSPAEARDWATAMSRELEFVDDDWEALRWALGSTIAVCRHSMARTLRDWRGTTRSEPLPPWRSVRSLKSILAGVAVALVVLGVSVGMLASASRAQWFEPNQGQLAERLFIVAIPEAVYLFTAVALWRPQRRVASGILAAAAILFGHSIVHNMTHG